MTPPSSRGGVLLLACVLEESRHLAPDFVRMSQKKVAPGREFDQFRVGDETHGKSGSGQRPVKVIGRADQQRRSTDSLQRILPGGSLGSAVVEHSQPP